MESGFGEYGISGNYYTTYKNQVGSFRMQTQYGGGGSTIVAGCADLPFGDARTCQTGSNPDDAFWFAGLYLDPSGDYHTPARQYSPVQGRWARPDPAGMAVVDQMNPQTWNLYAYVTNNPVSDVDPTGLYVMDCVWSGCGAPCFRCGGAGFAPGDYEGTYNIGSSMAGLLANSAAGAEAAWIGSGSIPWYSFNASGQLMIRVWHPPQSQTDASGNISLTIGGWGWVPVPGGQSSQGSVFFAGVLPPGMDAAAQACSTDGSKCRQEWRLAENNSSSCPTASTRPASGAARTQARPVVDAAVGAFRRFGHRVFRSNLHSKPVPHRSVHLAILQSGGESIDGSSTF